MPSPSTSPTGASLPVTPAAAHVLARRVTALTGVAFSLTAWLAVGVDGLAAGVLATLLVIGFFWAGLIPLFVVRWSVSSAAAGLGVLLLTYTLRLALVLLVLRLAARLEFVDGRWVGVTIVACALAYTAAHVAVSVRGDRRRSGALEFDGAGDLTTEGPGAATNDGSDEATFDGSGEPAIGERPGPGFAGGNPTK